MSKLKERKLSLKEIFDRRRSTPEYQARAKQKGIDFVDSVVGDYRDYSERQREQPQEGLALPKDSVGIPQDATLTEKADTIVNITKNMGSVVDGLDTKLDSLGGVIDFNQAKQDSLLNVINDKNRLYDIQAKSMQKPNLSDPNEVATYKENVNLLNSMRPTKEIEQFKSYSPKAEIRQYNDIVEKAREQEHQKALKNLGLSKDFTPQLDTPQIGDSFNAIEEERNKALSNRQGSLDGGLESIEYAGKDFYNIALPQMGAFALQHVPPQYRAEAMMDADKLMADAKAEQAKAERRGIPNQFVYDIASGGINLATMVGLSAINPALGVSSGYIMEGSDGYATAKEYGLSDSDASMVGVAVGLVNSALEYLPVARGIKRFKSKITKQIIADTPKLKSFIMEGLKSGSEEFITEMAQSYPNLIAESIYKATGERPEGIEKWLYEPLYQGMLGAILGGSVGGAGGVISQNIVNKEQKAVKKQFVDKVESSSVRTSPIDGLVADKLPLDLNTANKKVNNGIIPNAEQQTADLPTVNEITGKEFIDNIKESEPKKQKGEIKDVFRQARIANKQRLDDEQAKKERGAIYAEEKSLKKARQKGFAQLQKIIVGFKQAKRNKIPYNEVGLKDLDLTHPDVVKKAERTYNDILAYNKSLTPQPKKEYSVIKDSPLMAEDRVQGLINPLENKPQKGVTNEDFNINNFKKEIAPTKKEVEVSTPNDRIVGQTEGANPTIAPDVSIRNLKAEEQPKISITRVFDNFKETGAPTIIEQRMSDSGYTYDKTVYTPEAYKNNMFKSDETGQKVRWGVELSDGRGVSIDGAIRITKPEIWDKIKGTKGIKKKQQKLFDSFNTNEIDKFVSDAVKLGYSSDNDFQIEAKLTEMGHPFASVQKFRKKISDILATSGKGEEPKPSKAESQVPKRNLYYPKKGTKQPYELTRDEFVKGTAKSYYKKDNLAKVKIVKDGMTAKSAEILAKKKGKGYKAEADPNNNFGEGQKYRVVHKVNGDAEGLTFNEYFGKYRRDFERLHKNNVDYALGNGKKVPTEVLKDYPELNNKQINSIAKQPKNEQKPIVSESELNKWVSDPKNPPNKIGLKFNTPKGENEINSFLDDAINNTKEVQKKLDLWVVDKFEGAKLKEATGLDVEGYTHKLENFGIKHAIKRHGNDPLPITKDDFKKIPDIIKNYDTVEYVGKSRVAKSDIIRYSKRYNGHTYYFEEMRTGKHELVPMTMYKNKSGNDSLPMPGIIRPKRFATLKDSKTKVESQDSPTIKEPLPVQKPIEVRHNDKKEDVEIVFNEKRPNSKLKQKIKKIENKELDDAWKDFLDSSGTLTSGVDPVQLAKGIKLMSIYTKLNVYKFADIVNDAYAKLGDKLDGLMDALKKAYLMYQVDVRDDVLDLMDSPKDVRSFKLENHINNLTKPNNSRSLHNEGVTNEKNSGTNSENATNGREGVSSESDDSRGTANVPSKRSGLRERARASSREADGNIRYSEPDVSKPISKDGLQQQARDLEGQQTTNGYGDNLPRNPKDKLVSATTKPGDGNVSNLDLRGKEPVHLSRGERKKINAKVKGILTQDEITESDKEILRQYTGEGGLSSGETIGSLNQHYTDYPVIEAIHKAIDGSGLKVKKALEPAVGSGNFVGIRPDYNWTTVDIDKTNSEVTAALYPKSKNYNISFEKFKSKDFDLVISNVPFLEERGEGRQDNRPDVKALHDFYFLHALDRVKPNGIIAFVTSKGTMDKKDSTVREEIVRKADVIGAYRLPGGTFEKNAHTSVITDIIFLQKRPDGVEATGDRADDNNIFVNSFGFSLNNDVLTPYEGGLRLNTYYYKHKGNILGDLVIGKNKLYGGKEQFNVDGDADLSKIGISYYPYEESKAEVKKTVPVSGIPKDSQEFYNWASNNGITYRMSYNENYTENIFKIDTDIYEATSTERFDDIEETAKIYTPLDRSGEMRMKILSLDDLKILADNIQDGSTVYNKDLAQSKIDNYAKKFKTHPKKDAKLKKFFKDQDEMSYYLELTSSITDDFNPADVFIKQTKFSNGGTIDVTKDSPLKERAIASENIHGLIELFRTDLVAKREQYDLLENGYSLVKDGIVQNDILYYAGNVYNKIDVAQRALDITKNKVIENKLNEQIKKLEEIKPEPKLLEDIDFKGNEGWFKPFVSEVFPRWSTRVDKGSGRTMYISGFGKIYDNYLNNNQLVPLTYKDSKGNTINLTEAEIREKTGDALEKLQEVKDAVKERISRNPKLAERISFEYNSKYKNYVKPDYQKATYLIQDVLSEIPTQLPNGQKFGLRKNQIDWVVKALYEGKGINAHDVGGGKTYSAIVLARVLKQKGIAQKPVFVVPAKTITKWERDIKFLFPKAKVVNLGNLSANKRSEKLFEVANQEADYVLITDGGFTNLKLPLSTEMKYFNKVVTENIAGPDKTGRSASLEMLKIEKFKSVIRRAERDRRLTFDKLGFDAIFADEAHAYKNIGINSDIVKWGAGIPFSVEYKDNGKPAVLKSARSYDFRFKSQFITDNNNGKNVFLLTATPTPNKPMEIYSMLRHLDTEILDEYGIQTDRDFANTFLQFGSAVNPKKRKGFDNILTAIVNAQELRGILDRYVDKLSMDKMSWIKLPKAKIQNHFLKASDDILSIGEDISRRIKSMKSAWKPSKGDDTMIAVYTTGRAGGVDPRLYESDHAQVRVYERTMDSETDKIEAVIKNVKNTTKKNKDAGQIIFLDKAGHSSEILAQNIHTEIKRELVDGGFDETEVAIISGQEITNPSTGKEVKQSGDKLNATKQELVDLYNEGKIKIIIGTTKSAGEGMDIQVKTTDIYHLDIPYTPGEFIQRNGRGVRYGNENDEVNIHYYFTQGTFDKLSFDIVSRKRGWNEAIWDKEAENTIETVSEMLGGMPSEDEIALEMETDPVERRKLELEIKRKGIITDDKTAKDMVRSSERKLKYAEEAFERDEAKLNDLIEEREELVSKISRETKLLKDDKNRSKDYKETLSKKRKFISTQITRLRNSVANYPDRIKKYKASNDYAIRRQNEVTVIAKEFGNVYIPTGKTYGQIVIPNDEMLNIIQNNNLKDEWVFVEDKDKWSRKKEVTEKENERIVSDEKYKKANEDLKDNLNNLSSNPFANPKTIKALFTVGMYNAENVWDKGKSEAVIFRLWRKEMIKSYGTKISIGLRGLWRRIVEKLNGSKKREDFSNFMYDHALPKDEVNEKVGEPLSDESIGELLERKFIDKNNRAKRFTNVTNETDFYAKMELFTQKAANKYDKVLDYMVDKKKGFLRRLSDDGFNTNDLGKYLYAKHAVERNEYIFEKTEKENGSGITNESAMSILNEYKNTKIEEYADEFRVEIVEKTIKELKDGGILSDEQIEDFRRYEAYVPLKGTSKKPSRLHKLLGTKRFNVGSTGIMEARGRSSIAENPFVQAIIDYRDAVIRAEKNKVIQSFAKYIEENPNEAVYSIKGRQRTPVYNKFGEMESLNKSDLADNEIAYFERAEEKNDYGEIVYKAKQKVITINDELLYKTFVGLGATNNLKLLRSANNYLRTVITIASPEFLITNFERDLQTALVNIGGEKSVKIAGKVLKDTPKAIKAFYKGGDGKNTEWNTYYEEYKASGAKIGWMDNKDIGELGAIFEKRIERFQKEGNVKALLNASVDFVKKLNNSVENGVRLATYRALRENGASEQEASRYAKDLTVNFERKGELGDLINAGYLFWNAGMQGANRLYRATKSKNTRKIAAGLVALSVMQGVLNRLIDDDDEYKKLSNYEKDNHWIFMLGNGKYLKIKLPYGYNVFNVLGNVATDYAYGDTDVEKSAGRIGSSIVDAFNPFGSAGSLLQLLSPTLLDPVVQISENKNFFGSPIYKEQPAYQPNNPDSENYFKSVNPILREITTFLNSATGGNKTKSGAIDINPEKVEHILEFIGGGAGKFVSNSVGVTASLIKREELHLNKIPLVRKAVGEPNEWSDLSVIYTLLPNIQRYNFSDLEKEQFLDALDSALKSGKINRKKYLKYKEQYKKHQLHTKQNKTYTFE